MASSLQPIEDTDDKGRPLVRTMNDREIAEETLVILRAFGDALTALTSNPGAIMSRMMGGSTLAALMVLREVV